MRAFRLMLSNKKRILLMTCQAPSADPATCVHGVYQRFAMSLRAAAATGASTTIAAVYLVPREEVSVTETELETYYRRLSGIPTEVRTFCLAAKRHSTPWIGRRLVANVLDPHGMEKASFDADEWARIQVLLDERFDVIVVHRLLSSVILNRARTHGVSQVLDLDDIEHRVEARISRLTADWSSRISRIARAVGLIRLERRSVGRAGRTLVCSDDDRLWISRNFGARGVITVPNAVDVPPQIAEVERTANVLFVGTLGYEPNIDAARWLIEEIWPDVRARHPEATLSIVGRGQQNVQTRREIPEGVRFLGFVDELAPLYARAQVVVCPLRSGGGTRIKIIEAAMHARPVLSTSLGAEGLAFEPSSEIVIENTAEALTATLTDLLANPARCQRIGRAARQRAVELYSLESVVGTLRDELLAVMRGDSSKDR